jgi:L-threonylcarbamoyladenylate synthase
MSEFLKANPETYARAADILAKGGLVVLPTETVYGLAGLANNSAAINRIYDIKKRPRSKPLSAVIFSKKQARQLGEISPLAQQLIDKFWPGPLTLVLPLKANASIDDGALSGNKTVGIRFPDIAWVEAFEKAGLTDPLVLPSANTSGEPAPTTAAAARADIGDKVDLIIEAGLCQTGVESTIISVNNEDAKLLRIGAIAPEELAMFPVEWAVK